MRKLILLLASLCILIQQGYVAIAVFAKVPVITPYIGTIYSIKYMMHPTALFSKIMLLMDLPFTFALETLMLPFVMLRALLFGY